MPLYKVFSDRLARIAVWHVLEEEAALSILIPDGLRTACVEEAKVRFVHEGRRKEWLAARVLAHRHFQLPEMLAYAADGRPLLPDSGSFVSISHSGKFVAMALSAVPVGIDIEAAGNRAWRLKDKFLTETEQAVMDCITPSDDSACRALAAWTAKEAAFKYYAQRIPLKVITEVRIIASAGDRSRVECTVPENGSVLVHHFTWDGLAFAVASRDEEEPF